MGQLQNIAGQVFHRLTVLEFSHSAKGRAHWKCQCDCGTTTIVTGKDLRSGNTKICGCLSREKVIARNISNKGISRGYKNDLSSKRYGRLLVLEFSHMDKHHKSHWLCRCDCGNEIVIGYAELIKRTTKSCGCLRKEITAAQGRDNLKDLTGQQFGRLTVLHRSDENRNSSACWICRCECGTERSFCSADLLSGSTTSCGCYAREICSGENCSFWNPELTDEERAQCRARPYEYFKWAKQVKERDNHTCCVCSTTNSTMHAHHLIAYADDLDRRFDLDNGTTICRKHHIEFHSIYRLNRCTKNDLDNYCKSFS